MAAKPGWAGEPPVHHRLLFSWATHSLGRPTPGQCPPHFPSPAGSARRTSSTWLCSPAGGTLPFLLPCLPGDACVASRSAPGDPVRASCLPSSSTEHQPLGLSPGAHTLCLVVLSWHVSKWGAEPLLLYLCVPRAESVWPVEISWVNDWRDSVSFQC